MTPLRLSVLIEWENVLLAELGRSRLMLQQLMAQVHQLRTTPEGDGTQAFLARFRDPVELLVLYNDAQIDGDAVRSVVSKLVTPDNRDIELRFVPAAGRHYYELKNYGASLSKGDYILLLDSDVIPNPGWLLHLLGSFANPDVQVVGGNTFIDPDTLTGKAFALFWFFDLPGAGDGHLSPKHGFYANNVAFRRDVFLRFPFPPAPEGINRGACVRLADTLAANGIHVYRNSNASVRHPAPNGWRHFINRAIAQGRDRVFRRYPDPRRLPLRDAVSRLREHLRALSRIVRHRATVDLRLWQLPLALGLGTVYHLLQFSGEVGTRMNPAWMQRRFQI